MPSIPFTKQPLTLSEQIALLRSRGMGFADESLAAHYLGFINYYRLGAHHNRVWNRYFAFSLKLPTHRPVALRGSLNPDAPKKLYNTLAILAYFLDTISPGHHWKSRLEALLQEHAISTADMGFPPDWHDRAIWR